MLNRFQALFGSGTLPKFARVRQQLDSKRVPSPRDETRERLLAAGLQKHVAHHARIAITAGSRGMGDFIELLNGIGAAGRRGGGEPFLVPAMGSHGGATAGGQERLLNKL